MLPASFDHNKEKLTSEGSEGSAKITARLWWDDVYNILSAHRRSTTAIVYTFLAAFSYVSAFLLRFDFTVPAAQLRILVWSLPLVLLVRLAASYAFGITRGRWRYVGTNDVFRLVASTCTGTFVLFLLSWGLKLYALMPRSVLILDLLLFTWVTAATWITYRMGYEQLRARNSAEGPPSAVLIVGAGEAGTMLAREMIRSRILRRAIGFVDDDPAKANSLVHGLPILGTVAELGTIVKKRNVREILIAVPSASPAQLRRIVQECEATDLRFQVLPGLSEVFSGRVNLSQVRPLRIEDLLGRDPVALELPELYEDLSGESVLITGAAGSIGSELARQVAIHHPHTLVLLDQSETGLFDVSRDLGEHFPNVTIEVVVADIVDPISVDEVFRRFMPSRVFHAAAYKHVTMMQGQVREAIRNNVVGTWRVASAATRYGSKKFVFVSTDKAVAPTTVMGASKRLAEMLIVEMQSRFTSTTFAAVRFGNVLGSNGSVIPIFRQQIAAGKPLTVTHPDATRYFMMIPEAVQLILQASLLPEVRGQIAMLDMGEPVRIVDLARNLLRIAGLPHKNGKSIVYTGLRPGEKMHESLLSPEEESVTTRIEKVHIVVPRTSHHHSVIRLLEDWEAAFEAGRQDDVIRAFAQLFPDVGVNLETAAEPYRQVV
jgi:FlaA1/EpsC-like NDP-sugar epimerase